ncbi:Eco57I restriction-modification methylase domain-containing protein [Lactiplantibacillus plantarum]|jgi:methylase of polypeptide subunit release factors|uniref:Eco57I restriction-modification methylase domain-containing protein n=1 Tax=Lactiplantibacillus plantarum TaxID=1590 RepID=UPI0028FC2C5A|nr:N-6 DNA methylase [Lactiplantibacillus plantarum]WNW15409.1 N-6 DNA methylase [Lactiplantibacillus plantarum]WNW18383.1 N-6 DNA methylase [Lactiplantibacillus plantarum]
METFKDALRIELKLFEKESGIKLKNEVVRNILGNSDDDIKLGQRRKNPEIILWEFMAHVEQLFNGDTRDTNGVIYTPKNVADRMVGYIDDHLLNKTSKVIDPAVGSGALLIATLSEISKKVPNLDLVSYVQENLYGLDVLPENVVATKCALSIFLELQGVYANKFNVFCTDSLKIPEIDSFHFYRNKFDIVIGNPPYVRAKKISEEYRSFLREKWGEVIVGMPDLYIPFFALGRWLSKSNSQVIYISPNSYFSSLNGKRLRKFLLNEFDSIEIYSTQNDQIFGKGVLTYSAITSMKLSGFQNGVRKGLSFKNGSHIIDIKINNYDDEWRLLSIRDTHLISVLEDTFTPLSKLKFKNGIATQRNSIYSFDPIDLRNNNYILSTGEMIEKDVTRSFVLPNKSQLTKSRIIFPYELDQEGKKNILISEKKFMDKYPMAYRYLVGHKKTLSLRKSDNKVWYAYGRSQGIQESGPRLYLPYMGYKIHSFISENSNELFAAGYAIFSDDIQLLELIQKILLSNVFTFYLMKVSKPYASGYYSTAKNLIQKFSIPITAVNRELMKLPADSLVQNIYSLSDDDMNYIKSLTENI